MIKTNYKIQESILIKAPLKVVWENIVYFENSKKWSPWLILDEKCKIKIE
jgi:hypothetical protein